MCVFDSIDPLTRFVRSYWSSMNVSALCKGKFFTKHTDRTIRHLQDTGRERERAHAADRAFKVHLLFYPGLESRGYLTWHLPIKQIKCNHLPPWSFPGPYTNVLFSLLLTQCLPCLQCLYWCTGREEMARLRLKNHIRIHTYTLSRRARYTHTQPE